MNLKQEYVINGFVFLKIMQEGLKKIIRRQKTARRETS